MEETTDIEKMIEVSAEEEIPHNVIFVTNIAFAKKPRLTKEAKIKLEKDKDYLRNTTLEVPEKIMILKEKNYDLFKDAVESFAYNTITRRFRSEVVSAQVWLPLE